MKTSAFFTVTREVYLREALASWRRVRGLAVLSHMTFRVEPNGQQDSCLEIIRDFADDIPCDVQVVLNDRVLGVRENPHAGFASEFAGGSDYVIYAEDDTVVASSYLEYQRWAAFAVQSDPSALAVCGFRHGDLEIPPRVQPACLISGFVPIGWGTWKDRWENILQPRWFYDRPNSHGHHVGWDWTLNEVILPELGMKCLFPHRSQTDHRGFNGENYTPDMRDRGVGVSRDFDPDQVGDWALLDIPWLTDSTP